MPFRRKKRPIRRRKKLTVAKVNRKVNRLLGKQEKKYADTTLTYTGVDSSGSVNLLNIPNIIEGVGDTDRIGQKITLKSINIKGQLTVGHGLTPDNFNQLRIMLVKYQTHGSTTPPISAILQYHDPAVYTDEIQMNSLYKKNSTFKFKILYDKVHLLGYKLAAANNTHTFTPKRFKISHKVTNGDLHYTDVANPTGWTYALMYFSDSSAVNNPSISFVSRVTFVDQ